MIRSLCEGCTRLRCRCAVLRVREWRERWQPPSAPQLDISRPAVNFRRRAEQCRSWPLQVLMLFLSLLLQQACTKPAAQFALEILADFTIVS